METYSSSLHRPSQEKYSVKHRRNIREESKHRNLNEINQTESQRTEKVTVVTNLNQRPRGDSYATITSLYEQRPSLTSIRHSRDTLASRAGEEKCAPCECSHQLPQTDNELWDAQFCKWWGYKWLKKREEMIRQQLANEMKKELRREQQVKEKQFQKEKQMFLEQWERDRTQEEEPPKDGMIKTVTKLIRNAKKLKPAEKKGLQEYFATPCSSLTYNNCFCDGGNMKARCTSSAALDFEKRGTLCKPGKRREEYIAVVPTPVSPKPVPPTPVPPIYPQVYSSATCHCRTCCGPSHEREPVHTHHCHSHDRCCSCESSEESVPESLEEQIIVEVVPPLLQEKPRSIDQEIQHKAACFDQLTQTTKTITNDIDIQTPKDFGNTHTTQTIIVETKEACVCCECHQEKPKTEDKLCQHEHVSEISLCCKCNKKIKSVKTFSEQKSDKRCCSCPEKEYHSKCGKKYCRNKHCQEKAEKKMCKDKCKKLTSQTFVSNIEGLVVNQRGSKLELTLEQDHIINYATVETIIPTKEDYGRFLPFQMSHINETKQFAKPSPVAMPRSDEDIDFLKMASENATTGSDEEHKALLKAVFAALDSNRNSNQNYSNQKDFVQKNAYQPVLSEYNSIICRSFLNTMSSDILKDSTVFQYDFQEDSKPSVEESKNELKSLLEKQNQLKKNYLTNFNLRFELDGSKVEGARKFFNEDIIYNRSYKKADKEVNTLKDSIAFTSRESIGILHDTRGNFRSSNPFLEDLDEMRNDSFLRSEQKPVKRFKTAKKPLSPRVLTLMKDDLHSLITFSKDSLFQSPPQSPHFSARKHFGRSIKKGDNKENFENLPIRSPRNSKSPMKFQPLVTQTGLFSTTPIFQGGSIFPCIPKHESPLVCSSKFSPKNPFVNEGTQYDLGISNLRFHSADVQTESTTPFVVNAETIAKTEMQPIGCSTSFEIQQTCFRQQFSSPVDKKTKRFLSRFCTSAAKTSSSDGLGTNINLPKSERALIAAKMSKVIKKSKEKRRR